MYHPGPKDIERITDTMIAAFAEYPLMHYFFPNPSRRPADMAATFRFLLRHGMAAGRVECPDETGQAVAIWLPSEKVRRNLWEEIRYGGLGMVMRQKPSSIWRQIQVSQAMIADEFEILPEPHAYLAHISVHPTASGQGLGRSLLDSGREFYRILAGRPIYLETHHEKNLPFYQSNGYELVRKVMTPGTTIPCWCFRMP